MSEPLVSCVCPTYKRPRQLANVVKAFMDQTYPNKELIILDDAQQYPDGLSGPGWTVYSWDHRFPTLGEKRNKTVELSSGRYIAVWDDDDMYLPWHLEASMTVLQRGCHYTIPTRLWMEKKNNLQLKRNTYLFHGGWTFTREAFEDVQGYPLMQSGQDQGLLVKMKHSRFKRGDPITIDPRPSYVYRWCTISNHLHISGGSNSDEAREDRYIKKFAEIPMTPQNEIVPAYERDWMDLYDKAST